MTPPSDPAIVSLAKVIVPPPPLLPTMVRGASDVPTPPPSNVSAAAAEPALRKMTPAPAFRVSPPAALPISLWILLACWLPYFSAPPASMTPVVRSALTDPKVSFE